jgi:SPX domain protein involved in polyphosphate accumulation
MKFGKYLLANASPEWLQHYVDYRALKKQLRLGQHDGSAATGSISPRTTSLTTGRGGSASLSGLAEETFLVALNHEVQKVSKFTDFTSRQLLRAIQQLNATLSKLPLHADISRHAQQAHVLSERSQALEKYVNLNAQAFQKIIKKHDKLFPRAQVWQFYKVHLHKQAWHATSLQDIWEALTAAYNRIHTSTVPSTTTPLLPRSRSAQVVINQQLPSTPPQPPTQRPTTLKFWVTPQDTPAVKHALLENLPVRTIRIPGSPATTTAVQHTRHCIYLDNASLELYHNNLYQVRNALAVKLTWQDFGAGQRWPCPVAIQRRVCPHGWRAEPDAKASITISSEHLDQMLDGSLTVQQAWLDCLQLRSSQAQGLPGASAAPSRRVSADAAHYNSVPQAAGSSSGWQQQHAMARTAAPAAAHACAQDAGHEPPPHSSSKPPAATQHNRSAHATRVQQAPHSSSSTDDPAPACPPHPAPPPPEHFTSLFQELQQLQDVKQLVPQVYSSCSRATFQMPFDSSLVATLDEQVCFSAGGSSSSYSRRPKQQQVGARARSSQQDEGGQQQQVHPWQQQAGVEQSVYQLPYNVLKLVLAPGEQLPHWLRLLIAQGLLHEAEDFSSFVHGCAVLAPDVVRALPFWVDDPLVQRSIAAFACHLPGEEGWLEVAGGGQGVQGGSPGSSGQGLREALLRPGSPKGRRRQVSWAELLRELGAGQGTAACAGGARSKWHHSCRDACMHSLQCAHLAAKRMQPAAAQPTPALPHRLRAGWPAGWPV